MYFKDTRIQIELKEFINTESLECLFAWIENPSLQTQQDIDYGIKKKKFFISQKLQPGLIIHSATNQVRDAGYGEPLVL